MEKYHRLYEAICSLLYEAKGLDRTLLSADMPLQQLGLDSLDYMELMLLVRREFGIPLTAEMFIDNPELTLGELCHVMVSQ
ncbi:acyl carrier protein [Serratia ureilytica]|uniref:acyl carrier protein n=1 Tax=Serratia ureilytica TaxID=300181 RepID=UPI001D191ADC|nr:acyl carrier protein [Serratia ureilytica]MCC4107263.1 acyl carrier protein [Serratia ureilytica]